MPYLVYDAYAWLGRRYLFQIFDELDSFRGKEEETPLIRQLIAGDDEGRHRC